MELILQVCYGNNNIGFRETLLRSFEYLVDLSIWQPFSPLTFIKNNAKENFFDFFFFFFFTLQLCYPKNRLKLCDLSKNFKIKKQSDLHFFVKSRQGTNGRQNLC